MICRKILERTSVRKSPDPDFAARTCPAPQRNLSRQAAAEVCIRNALLQPCREPETRASAEGRSDLSRDFRNGSGGRCALPGILSASAWSVAGIKTNSEVPKLPVVRCCCWRQGHQRSADLRKVAGKHPAACGRVELDNSCIQFRCCKPESRYSGHENGLWGASYSPGVPAFERVRSGRSEDHSGVIRAFRNNRVIRSIRG